MISRALVALLKQDNLDETHLRNVNQKFEELAAKFDLHKITSAPKAGLALYSNPLFLPTAFLQFYIQEASKALTKNNPILCQENIGRALLWSEAIEKSLVVAQA